MMKGKVILFIVEGPSDHSALIPYIEEKLKILKLRVTVKEMHGDVLTEYIQNTRRFKINPSNVKGELKKSISAYFNQASVKAEGIKLTDVIKVYYVTDIDYCFHEKESHHKNKAKEFTDIEKEKMAIEFSEKALLNDKFFIEVFKNDSKLQTWETYRESYEGIKNYKGRACNMNNFLDEYGIK